MRGLSDAKCSRRDDWNLLDLRRSNGNTLMTPMDGPFAADRAVYLSKNTNALITTQDRPVAAGVPFDDG